MSMKGGDSKLNFQQDEVDNLVRLVDEEVATLILMRGDLVNITSIGDSVDELLAARQILWNMIDTVNDKLSQLREQTLALHDPDYRPAGIKDLP